MPGDPSQYCVNIIKEIYNTEKIYLIDNLQPLKSLENISAKELENAGFRDEDYRLVFSDLTFKLKRKSEADNFFGKTKELYQCLQYFTGPYFELINETPFYKFFNEAQTIDDKNALAFINEFLRLFDEFEKNCIRHYIFIAANSAKFGKFLSIENAIKKNKDKADKNIKDFLQKKMPKNNKGLTIDAFLITPVQRIPRYLLFFKDLKKQLDLIKEQLEKVEGEKKAESSFDDLSYISNLLVLLDQKIKRLEEITKDINSRMHGVEQFAENYQPVTQNVTQASGLVRGYGAQVSGTVQVKVDDDSNLEFQAVDEEEISNDNANRIKLAQTSIFLHYYLSTEWRDYIERNSTKAKFNGGMLNFAKALKKQIDSIYYDYFHGKMSENIDEVLTKACGAAQKQSRFCSILKGIVDRNPPNAKNLHNLNIDINEAQNILQQNAIFHAFLPFQRYANRRVTWFSTESKLKHELAKQLLAKRDEIYNLSLDERDQAMNGKSLYEYLCQEMHQVLQEFTNKNITFNKKLSRGKFFKYIDGVCHYLDKINPNQNSQISTRTLLLHGLKEPAENEHLALILNGLRVSQYYMNTHWGKQLGLKKNNKKRHWVKIADDFSKRLQQIYIHLDEKKIDEKACYFLSLHALDNAVICLENLADKGATQSPLYTFLKTMQKQGPMGRPKNSSMPFGLVQENIVVNNAKKAIFNCIQDQVKQPFVDYREKNATCWRKYLVTRCSDSYKEKWKEAKTIVNEDNAEDQQNIKTFLQNKLETHFKNDGQNKSPYQNGRLKQAATEAQNFVNNL